MGDELDLGEEAPGEDVEERCFAWKRGQLVEFRGHQHLNPLHTACTVPAHYYLHRPGYCKPRILRIQSGIPHLSSDLQSNPVSNRVPAMAVGFLEPTGLLRLKEVLFDEVPQRDMVV